MHRWSKLFVPTLREAPSDAEVASHKFLLRSGYVRQLGAGIYSYLFLGQRSINKIIRIVREEMDKIGQEFLLPGIMPSDLWEQSGRWTESLQGRRVAFVEGFSGMKWSGRLATMFLSGLLALAAPGIGFEIVTVVGESSVRRWDLSKAEQLLGYRATIRLEERGYQFGDEREPF